MHMRASGSPPVARLGWTRTVAIAGAGAEFSWHTGAALCRAATRLLSRMESGSEVGRAKPVPYRQSRGQGYADVFDRRSQRLWDTPRMRRQALMLAILVVAFCAVGPVETLVGLVACGGLLQFLDYVMPWLRGEPLLKSQRLERDVDSVEAPEPSCVEEAPPRAQPDVARPALPQVRTTQPSLA